MMNLKYYLRGLGIGVVVTALIMGIAAGRTRETLSNEEIKERARALGMVEESQVLADMLAKEEEASPEDENTPGAASDALSASVSEASPVSEEDSTSAGEESMASPSPDVPEDSDEENELPEDSAESADGTESSGEEPEVDSDEGSAANPDEGAENGAEISYGENVTIVIESGEGSFIVCQKLEDAGIVPLASEFDRYLYDNGYDKRINTGTYEIPVGASFEEIVRIIAKLN